MVLRMQHRVAASGLFVLASVSAASAATQLTPISLTGYNADGIADTGATVASTVSVVSLDGSGHVLYQVGDNTANPTFGVPAQANTTTTFTSLFNSNVTFAFQPVNANNLLFLHGTNDTLATEPTTGTLTLTTPTAYTSLALLAQGYDASVGGTYTLNFSNGTSAAATAFTAIDWFTASNIASVGLDRVTKTSGAFDNRGDEPTLKELDITVPTADQNLTLTSIAFADTDAASDHAIGIYGISGAATAVPEPASCAMLFAGAASLIGVRSRARRTR